MTVAIHNLTDTWNDAGTAFAAIRMNVTDTASDGASLLLDLQVGGDSKFRVSKDNKVFLGSDTDSYITGNANGRTIDIFRDGVNWARYGGGVCFKDLVSLGSSGAAPQVWLFSEGSNVFGQRNLFTPTQGQEHRWWNTFSDASNGEYGYASWIESANVFEIGTKALGTGTQRSLSLTAGSADILMPDLPTSDPSVAGALWNNAGVLNVSAG